MRYKLAKSKVVMLTLIFVTSYLASYLVLFLTNVRRSAGIAPTVIVSGINESENKNVSLVGNFIQDWHRLAADENEGADTSQSNAPVDAYNTLRIGIGNPVLPTKADIPDSENDSVYENDPDPYGGLVPYNTTEIPGTNGENEPFKSRFIQGPLVDDPGIKTILYWNGFFTSPDYRFGTGQRPFLENNCPVNTCQVTTNKTLFDKSAAVLFHGPWIEEFAPLPDHRNYGQIYVFVQNEPQMLIGKHVLPRYRGMFNLTLTNRLDSDIHLPYGWVERSDRPWLKKKREGVFVSPKSRPREIVWMVSHCETSGKREWYVEELQKYILVDIYGGCGGLVCENKSDICMRTFVKQYKFYLALENDVCKDYITEKMFRTLEYDIIPIVYGGGDYRIEAPPNSVINIMDYPKPKDLAKYLHYLGNNENAYASYFTWKTKYEVETFRRTIYARAFCQLCAILHNSTYHYRSKEYHEIDVWWLTDMCDSNAMTRFRNTHHW